MLFMFGYAINFNQDLCAWYNILHTLAVTGMFKSSGCTNQTDPNFSSKSSFCQTCSCAGGKLLPIVWPIKSVPCATIFNMFFYIITVYCK